MKFKLVQIPKLEPEPDESIVHLAKYQANMYALVKDHAGLTWVRCYSITGENKLGTGCFDSVTDGIIYALERGAAVTEMCMIKLNEMFEGESK